MITKTYVEKPNHMQASYSGPQRARLAGLIRHHWLQHSMHI